MNAPHVHHVALSVTSAERSADWYQRLLGEAAIIHRQGEGWTRIRMQWESGLVIGVTEHAATPAGDRFDCTRPGLDHLVLGCQDEDEVRAWARRLDELGFEHGPVEDVPYGWAITARDPDGIAVEFFAPRTT